MSVINALALPVLALLIAGFITFVASKWLGKGRALSPESLAEEDDPNVK